MVMAHKYNKMTGANITHQEVAEWGFVESIKIESAMELLDG